MIRLYSPFSGIVMVWPERITHVKPDHESPELTRVYFDNNYVMVSESVEEVARKVLEWRLAIIDYHHNIPSVKTKAMVELVKLAGLEEPKNDRKLKRL